MFPQWLRKESTGVTSDRPRSSSSYSVGFRVPEAFPPPKHDRSRWWVFGSIGLAGVSLVTFVLMEMRRIPLTHYIADDYSASAKGLVAERDNHCRVSLSLYKPGDRRVQILFADIPEVVNDQLIENTFLFDPCTEEIPAPQIGQQPGTSVIHLLELGALEVQRERRQHPQQRAVLTATLSHNEVVGDQPALDSAGLERLQTAVATILGDEQGAIALIGPGGALQNQLKETFQNNPRVAVCSFAATQACVEAAFSTVR